MKNGTRAVRAVCLCILTWLCAMPCAAQAPDQDPTAQRRARMEQPEIPGVVGRLWGPEQATGAPDTDRAGDLPTAWASLNPDDGPEWLRVDFEQPVALAEVRIRESYNPGAVSKVTAIMQDGGERVLWEGTDPTVEALADLPIKVAGDVVSKSVKVYLDTARVQGWNEIDAVELVARDGKRQWASRASASSTFATRIAGPVPAALEARTVAMRMAEPTPGGMGPAQFPFAPMPDPLADIVQKRVVVHLDGDKTVTGTYVRTTPGFIVLEQPEARKTIFVNVMKVVYIETVD
jgi:hypothetical protein